jgi:hypothetical protein
MQKNIATEKLLLILFGFLPKGFDSPVHVAGWLSQRLSFAFLGNVNPNRPVNSWEWTHGTYLTAGCRQFQVAEGAW